MLHIDEKRCSGDGFCVRDCPAACLTLIDGVASVRANAHCLKCGHCVAICPRAAISLDGQNPDDLPSVSALPTEESMTSLIRSHRSIRQFKDAPLPRELILRALNTARYAPTGKNVENVRWLVLDGREKLRSVASSVVDAMRGLPELAGVVRAHDGGKDPIFRGAPCAIFAHADETYPLSAANCTIAIAWLDLLLPTMGIGTCWAGFVVTAALRSKSVRRAMGLKEDTRPFAGLMAGWPKVRYARIPLRKQPDITWVSE